MSFPGLPASKIVRIDRVSAAEHLMSSGAESLDLWARFPEEPVSSATPLASNCT